MATMTRSQGTLVVSGGRCFYPGGGYSGATEALDSLVIQEAEALKGLFGKDVSIRFNSNRESGGAWLVNSLKGFNGNCQVGLNAGLREGKIRIDTYVDVSALINPQIANEFNNTKSYVIHETLPDALQWLTDNIDTDKLYQ